MGEEGKGTLTTPQECHAMKNGVRRRKGLRERQNSVRGEEESRVGGFVVAWEKEINAASVLCVFGGVWAHLC